MSMFQKSVINRYLAGIGHDQIEVAYQNFKADYTSAKIAKNQTDERGRVSRWFSQRYICQFAWVHIKT